MATKKKAREPKKGMNIVEFQKRYLPSSVVRIVDKEVKYGNKKERR